MEVKKAGKYKMRNGKQCEVYGFDDLGGGPVRAEGFDAKDRRMMHWNPEDGKFVTTFGKAEPDEQFDIVEVDDV